MLSEKSRVLAEEKQRFEAEARERNDALKVRHELAVQNGSTYASSILRKAEAIVRERHALREKLPAEEAAATQAGALFPCDPPLDPKFSYVL